MYQMCLYIKYPDFYIHHDIIMDENILRFILFADLFDCFSEREIEKRKQSELYN